MDHLGRMGLSEEQAELLDVATKFCRKNSPINKVRKLIDDETGHDENVWREIAGLGWVGIAIPEEYGGVGLGFGEVAPVMEQMGRFLLASPFFSTTLAAQALLIGGTEKQKRFYLPKIIDGMAATLALSESECDWNLEAVRASATPESDGWKLSGVKNFVTDAAAADMIVVSALCNGKPALFCVERSAIPDGALRRETIIDETKRSYELKLDGVLVGADALFDVNKIQETLAHIHLAANLLTSAEMVGGTQSVIDYTIDYLKTRKQFGRLIGSYQSLKHPTVDAFLLYEQARSHLYAAANCFNEQGTGEIATRMAKVQADGAYSYAADRAIQFHGGFGFTYDCDAQLYRRAAIWHVSQFGDAAFHRRKLAELLL